MLPRGLEPRTLGLLDLRSDQLSYESFCLNSISIRDVKTSITIRVQ